MFDRAWIENELAGLIIQLHQTEGAISVLQQMLAQVDQAETQPTLTEEGLLKLLPSEAQLIGAEVHEDSIHP